MTETLVEVIRKYLLRKEKRSMTYVDTLYHHGIKGQKWGVRRFQKKDGSLTRIGRIHAKSLKDNGEQEISDDDNLKISKNSSLYRVTGKGEDNKDIRYVSYRQNDRRFYKGTWGKTIRENDKDAAVYEQSYTNKENLFIPSAKTRRKVLSDLLDDDDVIRSFHLNYSDIDAKTFDAKKKYYCDSFRDMTKTWSESERAKFVSKDIGKEPDVLAKYGEKVVQLGFNATVDDSGRCVGEMPLINIYVE